MRISDWSSDVCSSDLGVTQGQALIVEEAGEGGAVPHARLHPAAVDAVLIGTDQRRKIAQALFARIADAGPIEHMAAEQTTRSPGQGGGPAQPGLLFCEQHDESGETPPKRPRQAGRAAADHNKLAMVNNIWTPSPIRIFPTQ